MAALAASLAGGDGGLWRHDLTRGGAPSRLLAGMDDITGARYSPDGRRLAVASRRGIWLADAEGRNPVLIASLKGEANPAWSPDGSEVAFDAMPESNPDIYVVAASGGTPRRLTNELCDNLAPAWSPDGKWIYFGSNRTFAYEIWRVPARGGKAVQVTRRGGYRPVPAGEGNVVYYAKSPRMPGLWRVTAEGEEIAVMESFPAGLWASWDLLRDGVYFMRGGREGRVALIRLDLAKGSEQTVGEFESGPKDGGLALSPGGRYLLMWR